MSVFSAQNTRLANGITSIVNAIEAKGGTVVKANATAQIEELATGVGTIVTGGGGTVSTGPTTHADYFTFLSDVLAVTRTELTHRATLLMDPIDDTFTNSSSMGNTDQVWIMSDGATYTGSSVNHTWDKTKDNDYPMGRWMIQSFSGNSGYVFVPSGTTYCLLDNCPMSYNSCFKYARALRGIKMANMGLTWPTQTSIAHAGFYCCNALACIDGLNISNITNLNTWAQAGAIQDVRNITGLNVSLSLDTDTLSRESMLNMFNCMGAVTGQKLKINNVNLARLTESDLLIATNKGWSVT